HPGAVRTQTRRRRARGRRQRAGRRHEYDHEEYPVSTTDAAKRPRIRRPRRSWSRRTRLIVRSIIAVIAVAAIVGITYLIMHALTDDSAERPVVTATAGENTVEVEPFEWCDPKTPTECDPPGDTAELRVSEGTP